MQLVQVRGHGGCYDVANTTHCSLLTLCSFLATVLAGKAGATPGLAKQGRWWH
jgi:hypothetical protein